MLFSSITFLFAFLPAVILVYYICPKKIRNLVLLTFSLLFYAWGEPKYVIVMIATIIIGYISGILTDKYINMNQIKKAKYTVAISVIINIGVLFFFKYTNFFIKDINNLFGTEIGLIKLVMPIGISFYTFQMLSYTVDVYRKKAKVQKNIINLAAYITLFPQLIAGPIVRYETIAEQLENRTESFDNFGLGVSRFVVGLGKKVLIANTAGEIFDRLSGLTDSENSVILAWMCAIAFSLQIYFDFSGYSDMAIGLGSMFGFKFLENFNYPYISKSISDFWRRWHISLSTWFRDYLYIPLGGNRNGRLKTYRNLFIVWLLTGFWHGAAWNFIIWGLYYFSLLMLEKSVLRNFINKAPKCVTTIYSLIFINFGWVIFAYDSLPQLGNALGAMFGIGVSLCNDLSIYYLISYGLFLLIALVGTTPIPATIGRKITALGKNEIIGTVLTVIFTALVLLLSTSFLASDAFNPFLYFRF